jgi:hypothetical protein
MRTVEENFSSEVRDSGIFVLTNQPYPTLPRELAEAVMEQGKCFSSLIHQLHRLPQDMYLQYLKV